MTGDSHPFIFLSSYYTASFLVQYFFIFLKLEAVRMAKNSPISSEARTSGSLTIEYTFIKYVTRAGTDRSEPDL